MSYFSIPFAFANFKMAVIDIVTDAPKGIKQAQVARELGIPANFDNNWITKSMLDGLVKEEILVKDENKFFTLKLNS